MRTVIDAETRAFEAGYRAYKDGVLRRSNPYSEGDKLRASWFDGWDYGATWDGSSG